VATNLRTMVGTLKRYIKYINKLKENKYARNSDESRNASFWNNSGS
jgi:hypothetical protein